MFPNIFRFRNLSGHVWSMGHTSCFSRPGSSPYWRASNKLRFFITPVVQIARQSKSRGLLQYPMFWNEALVVPLDPPAFREDHRKLPTGSKIMRTNRTPSMRGCLIIPHWGMLSRGLRPHQGQGAGQESYPSVKGSPSTSTQKVKACGLGLQPARLAGFRERKV